MTSDKKTGKDDRNGGRLQIHFRLDWHENQALFDYLESCPKGSCRTARLKLLAHEGMRSLLLQGGEFNGNRTSSPVDSDTADRSPRPSTCNVPVDEAHDEAVSGDVAMRGLSTREAAPCSAAPAGTAAEIFGSPTDDLQFANRLR